VAHGTTAAPVREAPAAVHSAIATTPAIAIPAGRLAIPTAAHLVATSSTAVAAIVLHPATAAAATAKATVVQELAIGPTNAVGSVATKLAATQAAIQPDQIAAATAKIATRVPTAAIAACHLSADSSTAADQVVEPAITASFGATSRRAATAAAAAATI